MKETAVTIINTASAGKSIKSKYGITVPKPIAPKIITSSGVKQQTATATVPISDAINVFLCCFITD